MAPMSSPKRPLMRPKIDKRAELARGSPPGHQKVSKHGVKMVQNPSSIDSKFLCFSFLETFADRFNYVLHMLFVCRSAFFWGRRQWMYIG